MLIPYFTKQQKVDSLTFIKPGDIVSIHTDVDVKDGFQIVSFALSGDAKAITLVKDDITILFKIDNGNRDCLLISDRIEPFKITGMRKGAKAVSLDDFTYKSSKMKPTLIPVAPGDILTTNNKKFVVEFIASDGSIVAKVEGKSQAKMTTECVMLKHSDVSLVKALYEEITWKWK